MTKVPIWLAFFPIFIAKNSYAQSITPIQFPEYNLSLEAPFRLGDTILHKYSHDEFFKFVFFEFKGRCYCERYINGRLCEKGYYANSLDTLKKYVAGKFNHGKSTKISILAFFQPLKNGEWITFENGASKSEKFIMGVPANKLVPE